MRYSLCIVAVILLAGCRGEEADHSAQGDGGAIHEGTDVNPQRPGGAASNDRERAEQDGEGQKVYVDLVPEPDRRRLPDELPRDSHPPDGTRPDVNPERPGGAPE